MKKRLSILLATGVILSSAVVFSGCEDESIRVNQNITQQAQNFNVYRRVTVINCIKKESEMHTVD